MPAPPRQKLRAPVGAAPDVLMAPVDASPTVIEVMDYGPEHCKELRVKQIGRIRKYKEGDSVTWVDVQGLAHLDVLRKLSDLFDIHPLALADVVHVPQLPKAEKYGPLIFIIGRYMHHLNDGSFVSEQISFFLGEGWLISFQESSEPDVLASIRVRIRNPQSRIRSAQTSYLAYAILDLLVDSAFPELEASAESLTQLEERAMESLKADILQEIRTTRKASIELARVLRHQRKTVQLLLGFDSRLVSDQARIFLRDVQDHVGEQLELAEHQAEAARSVRDFHLAMLDHRMNDVMRLLTIIATIFIPLSFFAGVYGMNFETGNAPLNMPELRWQYGYLVWWLVVIVVAAFMVWWFHKKGWIRLSLRRRGTAQPSGDALANDGE